MSVSPQPGNPHRNVSSNWMQNMPQTPSPPRSPKRYALSEQYIHLVESPEQFRPVLAERLARLQNTLPQLSLEGLKQAKADIVYLKSILDDEGMNIAQVRAGAVYSART